MIPQRVRRPISGQTNRSQAVFLREHKNGSMNNKKKLQSLRTRPSTSHQVIRARKSLAKLNRPRSVPALEILARDRKQRENLDKFLVNNNHLRRRPSHLEELSKTSTEKLIKNIAAVVKRRYDGGASLKKLFLHWDKNRDGYIDSEEMKEAAAVGGWYMTEQQAENICKAFGNGVGKIEYSQFVDYIFQDQPVEELSSHHRQTDNLKSRLIQLGVSEEQIKALVDPKHAHYYTWEEIKPRLKRKYQAKKSLAREYEKINDKKDGFIEDDELRSFLAQQGFVVTNEEFRRIFDIFDKNHDGKVEFMEFASVVFPEEDIGAFKRLTPRSDVDETEQISYQNIKNDEMEFIDSEVPQNLDDAVADVLRAARVRDVVSKKLWEVYDQNVTEDAFKAFDANGDGQVSLAEFRESVMKLDIGLSEEDCDMLSRYVDKDGSGFIDYDEFWTTLTGRFGAARKVNTLQERPQTSGAVTKMQTVASLSNIGMVRVPSGNDILMMKQRRAKKAMFPTHNIKFTSYGRQNKKNKTKDKSESDFGCDVSLLKPKMKVPTRRSSTPSYKTRNLISPASDLPLVIGSYACDKGTEYDRESTRYNLSSETAYHNTAAEVRRRQRQLNKIERKRKVLQEYEERSRSSEEDPDRRLRTLVSHRYNYYVRLQGRFQKDEEKRALAGW